MRKVNQKNEYVARLLEKALTADTENLLLHFRLYTESILKDRHIYGDKGALDLIQELNNAYLDVNVSHNREEDIILAIRLDYMEEGDGSETALTEITERYKALFEKCLEAQGITNYGYNELTNGNVEYITDEY